MKYKNKIKAVFKAIGRVFVVLIGIALIIYLTIDIGTKPPLMANRNARNNTQLYSMEDNNNYWSTSGEYNYIGDLGFDIENLDWQVDSTDNGYNDEFYLDDIEFGSNFNSTITFCVGFEVIDTTNIYTSYELYIGLPFTDFSSIDDDTYYYIYSALDARGYDGDTVDGYSYSLSYIKFRDSFYNPILKGSFIKDNLEYFGFTIYCDLTNVNEDDYVGSYLTFRLGLYNLSGFVDLNYDDGYDIGFDDGYQEGYDTGFDGGYTGGYIEGNEEGYDEGYTTGVVTGMDTVLLSPNIYGLYDEQQYISYGQNQYGSGYNNGLAANGVVGLDWFKASISVVNDFLNIMILPNVTIGNIFAGVIILVILSWVLSWFRG